MFEPRTLIQKHHEERTSYLRKFASFMNKRVLTPTFGDNIEKKKRDLNESYNQENDFDICDLNLFKKEKTIVTSTKHPIISRKSPLFDKFGKRNSHETSVEKKIIEIHDNNDEKNLNKNKNNEVLFNKNRIIFRKRDSSAKKPKEEVFPVASRLFTPQSKKTKNNLSPLNGNFIFERLQMNKKIDINKNKLLNNSKELLNSVNENYISTKKENFKSLEDIIENLKNVSEKDDKILEIVMDLKEFENNQKVLRKNMIEFNNAKWRKILKRQKTYYDEILKFHGIGIESTVTIKK